MTPLFIGSEPVVATSGKFKGTSIMQNEQDDALKLVRALSESQRSVAILESSKESNNNLSEAFHDNVVLDYAGLKVSEFSAAQKKQLLGLMGLYANNMDDGHAKLRMEEIEAHLDETYFAWIGGTADDSVFYYRIHSPVVLVEFDHQRPVGIRHLYPGVRLPIREHVHAVVRTPNGNDYGKDLLRQHFQQSHTGD